CRRRNRWWATRPQIGEAGLGIGGDLGPNAGVSGVVGGAAEPGVVALRALDRDRVPLPELLAVADIVGARRTAVVAETRGREAFLECRPHQHLVANHGGRRLPADFAGGQIGQDLLIVGRLQIHLAGNAKRWNRLPRLGVERDQKIPRRDVKDARALAVRARPVREAAAGELPRRGRAALALAL